MDMAAAARAWHLTRRPAFPAPGACGHGTRASAGDRGSESGQRASGPGSTISPSSGVPVLVNGHGGGSVVHRDVQAAVELCNLDPDAGTVVVEGDVRDVCRHVAAGGGGI